METKGSNLLWHTYKKREIEMETELIHLEEMATLQWDQSFHILQDTPTVKLYRCSI